MYLNVGECFIFKKNMLEKVCVSLLYMYLYMNCVFFYFLFFIGFGYLYCMKVVWLYFWVKRVKMVGWFDVGG